MTNNMRVPFDPDYGPYTGHPADPRTPEPPEWEDMTRDERVAELAANIRKSELIDMYLDECERTDRLLAKLARLGIKED